MKENRLIYQVGATGPEASAEGGEADILKLVREQGFRNGDESFYDPETNVYTDKDGSVSTMTPEAAVARRQPDAKPYLPGQFEAVPPVAEAQTRRETGQVEATAETTQATVRLKTSIDLERLKGKLGGNLSSISDSLNLGGSEIDGDVFFNKDFTFSSLKDSIAIKFEQKLNEKVKGSDLKSLVELINEKMKGEKDWKDVTGETLIGFISEVYSNSVVVKMENEFNKTHKGYKGFSGQLKDGVDYQFPYGIKVEGFSGFKVEFDIPKDFEDAYKAYIEANPDESGEVADPKKANLEERVADLKKHPAGTVLMYLGFLKQEPEPVTDPPETDVQREAREKRNRKAYEDVIKGDNVIAKWIVYFLGGGSILDGGGSDVGKAIAGLRPDFRGLAEKFREATTNLPMLSMSDLNEKYRSAVDAIAGLLPFGRTEFAELMGGKAMPEKGISLNEECKVADGKKLNIVLEGGKMILPKGAKIRKMDGAESVEVAADEKSSREITDKQIAVIGSIPTGTIFQGKVTFKEEVLS